MTTFEDSSEAPFVFCCIWMRKRSEALQNNKAGKKNNKAIEKNGAKGKGTQ
jgi:hypothetical protein